MSDSATSTAGPIRSPLLATLAEATAETGRPSSLLEALLREQQTLTAVERFSRVHDDGLPAQAKYYRALIPEERPRPGQQYAFEVDLDACTGCKACVAACHSLNGLDGPEVWRTVGLLHGGTREEPVQRTVTTSCHHCVDPSCLAGCPVKAYEKDPVTGIVRHLDDQCIGCQYCTLMCPYDAPKYSPQRGIVRKCDMCTDRLAVGEAPACVQGCPNEAIKIRVIDQIHALEASQAARFLPGAPGPDHTVPTTVYKSKTPPAPGLVPADFYTVSPEHSHSPLVVLLVFTQLAVGAFATLFLGKLFLPRAEGAGAWSLAHAGFSLAMVLLALGLGSFHLGRPRGAWRVFLGLRTSWFSREALAFAGFAKLGVLYAASVWLGQRADLPAVLRPIVVGATPILEGATAAVGIFAVVCSVMLYVVTRRTQWRARITTVKFFGTTALLGAATVLAVSQAAVGLAPVEARATLVGGFGQSLLAVIVAAALVKAVHELLLLRHVRAPEHTVLKRMAILMLRDLRLVTVARYAGLALGGLLLPALMLTGASPRLLAPVALALLVAGELCERYLFFRAAPASRMPGGL